MRAVSGSGIDLIVDDQDGGKITSLVASNREWLAPSTSRDPIGDYGGGGGWDECAPTVGRCTLPDGTELLDHGDAWRSPWTVTSSDPGLLDMHVRLPSVNVVVRRVIEPFAGGLRMTYSASTDSPATVPFLWSAHPLFAAPPATRIVVKDSRGVEHFPRHRRRLIPRRGSIDRIRRGTALKMFATTPGSWAAVEHADGARLTISWNPKIVSALGLYWDVAVFTDAGVVAIEPTTGRHDLASTVLESLPRVGPHAPLEWWLQVTQS